MVNIYQTSAKIYYQRTALDRDISSLKKYTNLNTLANRIKLRIISQLEHLRPGKNSKIINYGEKLNKHVRTLTTYSISMYYKTLKTHIHLQK